MTGVVLGESPRWHDGRLWFADWGARIIYAIDAHGRAERAVEMDTFPFCFDWMPDGRMVIVVRDGRLLVREREGSLTVRADLAAVAQHPWNDIVIDGRGNTYVNNIGFEFPGGEFAPGIVALVTADGSAQQVADGVAFPNGMAVTPDNATLILAESYANRLTAFDIGADGRLSNRRVWAAVGDDHPDGICVDAENAVWYADVGNSHCVRVREGGEVLQTVVLDRGCFACTLGGEHGRTLFVVAAEWPLKMDGGPPTGQVVAVEVAVPRAGRP
jgi:sugar lactone lactonase YvrE